jgi:signal transduction histidine kinase/DNA-binding response OmpR family regulator
MSEELSQARVLVLAPNYKDGVTTRSILEKSGCTVSLYHDLKELCVSVENGAGVVIVTDDQLVKKAALDLFCNTINQQPAWSDLPIVLLATGGAESPAARALLVQLPNVLVLERPVHIPTLISAVKSSLRSRERQYEICSLLQERERAQDVLRESEQRHRLVTETMLQGIVYQNVEGTIISMNPAAERILGFSHDEFLGTSFVEQEYHTVREDGSSFSGMDHPAMVALRTGKPVSDVVMGIHNPQISARRWIRIDAIPLFRPGEYRPFQVYTVFDDITEHKLAIERLWQLNDELEKRVAERTAEVSEAADKLRGQRQRLFDVLETLPVMVSLIRPDYRVEFANRAYRDALGNNQDLLCYISQFGRTKPCDECQAFSVLQTGKPHKWEWQLTNGRIFEIYNAPFTDVDGSPMILEMDVDVTDRRQAEQQLQYAHQDLQHRAAQLRALASELTLAEQRERKRLAMVLHDGLQQMLVATKFQLALIEKGSDLRQVTADISNLIDDCIETSRSLTAELSPPVLHRRELIPALEWLVQWMRDRHGLSVELMTQGQIKAVPEDITVLLFQSVRELLFNVVKHAGTRKARIMVIQLDHYLELNVSDEGAGFDPGLLSSRPATGSGMGLLSVRERLNYIGGTMEADSFPGRGARFTLTIPVSDAELIKGSRNPAAFTNRGGPDQDDAKKIRILLVDDHLVMRQGLARLLQSEPDMAIVGEACDGRSAVDLVSKTNPAVVLMDINMPVMDGIEATQIIHQRMPELTIIGLSTFEQGKEAAAMLKAGAVAYLEKTGPLQALIETIRNCANTAQSASLRQTMH